jgi:hypothetical protein
MSIGSLPVEDRSFSIKWCGGLFYVDFVSVRFQKLVWYLWVGVCVLESILVCGLFVDSFCAVFVNLRFWCVYYMVQVLVLEHFVTLTRYVQGFRVVVACGL